LLVSADNGPIWVGEDVEDLLTGEPSSVFELVVKIESDGLGGIGSAEAADHEVGRVGPCAEEKGKEETREGERKEEIRIDEQSGDGEGRERKGQERSTHKVEKSGRKRFRRRYQTPRRPLGGQRLRQILQARRSLLGMSTFPLARNVVDRGGSDRRLRR
jgi:hypothetical protein